MTDTPADATKTSQAIQAKTEEIGLLLVHGMGEQKRLGHLRTSAKELTSFIAETPGLIRLSIIDDLSTSETIIADATFEHDGREERVRVHLHEAWWADLGISGGLFQHVKFWLWGLGQWAAKVAREGNPGRNTVKLMAMPSFERRDDAKVEPGGTHRPPAPTDKAMAEPGGIRQLPARALLVGAAFLAIFTFFTWSAAKQIVTLLARRGPDPSLIFLFLGDVKIYEQDGFPGAGSLLDPDQPMRTTIRRRIVSKMTLMAAQDYDKWYILAHSLGTIPAYNAVQETELALPNYLTEAEWNALPAALRTSAPFVPADTLDDPPTTTNMMPRRPPWLKDSDGIDRRKLFERFAGFVTYGSPLDKFAALWPRVVCLNRQAAVFPAGCEWVNLHDPTDPVSASLDAFAPPPNRADGGVTDRFVLVPKNFASRASRVWGLSHIRYFRPRPKGATSMPAAIVGALVSRGRTSLSEAAAKAMMPAVEAAARGIAGLAQLAAVAVALVLAAALLLLAIGRALPDQAADLVKRAIGAVCPRLVEMLQAGGWPAIMAAAMILILLALLAIAVSGIARFRVDLRKRRERKQREEEHKKRQQEKREKEKRGMEDVQPGGRA